MCCMKLFQFRLWLCLFISSVMCCLVKYFSVVRLVCGVVLIELLMQVRLLVRLICCRWFGSGWNFCIVGVSVMVLRFSVFSVVSIVYRLSWLWWFGSGVLWVLNMVCLSWCMILLCMCQFCGWLNQIILFLGSDSVVRCGLVVLSMVMCGVVFVISCSLFLM